MTRSLPAKSCPAGRPPLAGPIQEAPRSLRAARIGKWSQRRANVTETYECTQAPQRLRRAVKNGQRWVAP